MVDYCVIANPQAGRGLVQRRLPVLYQALAAAGLACNVRLTGAPGDTYGLTQQAIAQGCSRLVAVGGDGTIHAVASTILAHADAGDVALGVVPMGTGNDFIKSLDGLRSNDIDAAVARLAAGQTRRIDAGRVRVTTDDQTTTYYSINNLALGIDAYVAAEQQRSTWLRGLASYLVGAVRALLRYQMHPMTLHFNQTTIERPLLLATIANGRCQGGGFWLTPTARLDDGLLDLCLVERLRLDQIPRYMLHALRGTHTTLKRVTMAQASRIVVEYTTPTLVVSDGEVLTERACRLDVETLPGTLLLVA